MITNKATIRRGRWPQFPGQSLVENALKNHDQKDITGVAWVAAAVGGGPVAPAASHHNSREHLAQKKASNLRTEPAVDLRHQGLLGHQASVSRAENVHILHNAAAKKAVF